MRAFKLRGVANVAPITTPQSNDTTWGSTFVKIAGVCKGSDNKGVERDGKRSANNNTTEHLYHLESHL